MYPLCVFVCVILWYVFKLDELVPSCVQLLCLCTVPSVLFKVEMEEVGRLKEERWISVDVYFLYLEKCVVL